MITGTVTLAALVAFVVQQGFLDGSGGTARTSSGPAPELPAPIKNPDGSIQLGPGTRLVPGEDGTLPLSVVWMRPAICPDGLAVDRDRVYVFGCDSFDALALGDGSTIWEVSDPDQEGFPSSGGVLIGTDGPGRVNVWAPWEVALDVDEDSGKLLGMSGAGGDEPSNIKPFDHGYIDGDGDFVTDLPDGSTLTDDADLLTKADSDGRILWSIEIAEPEFDFLGPVDAPGGLVLVLPNEVVVRLDDTTAAQPTPQGVRAAG